MRRPAEIERMYADFDGFFASVMQQKYPELRGKPVGVVPFAAAAHPNAHSCVIACSREAKVLGLKNVMPIGEAKAACPDLILVPQEPDLYRRAHNTLLSEIEAVVPIDAIKSIDELTCRVTPDHRGDPQALGRMVKARIAKHVGPYITCSIGFAANRQLAKMACKAGKRTDGKYGDGNCVWHPNDMPDPLLDLPLSDVPGIGTRMEIRLAQAGVRTMADLLAMQPKHMRKLWRNVTGERLWYALHGYDIQTPPSSRGMFGHGRVLPPEARTFEAAKAASRTLIVKAARRMRRENWNAGRLWLSVQMDGKSAGRSSWLPDAHDDQIILSTLESLWADLKACLARNVWIISVHVLLGEISPANARQLDLLLNDDRIRQKWEILTKAIDKLNARYGGTIITVGVWSSPPGDFAGQKISYTRIPRMEDRW